MKVSQPLIEVNPYLKDTTRRLKALCRHAESSSAIEGIVLKVVIFEGKPTVIFSAKKQSLS